MGNDQRLSLLEKKNEHKADDSNAFFHFYLCSLLWLCVLLYKEGWQ